MKKGTDLKSFVAIVRFRTAYTIEQRKQLRDRLALADESQPGIWSLYDTGSDYRAYSEGFELAGDGPPAEVLEALEISWQDLPLYINHKNFVKREVAKWRLWAGS